MSLNLEGYMNRHVSYIDITETPASRYALFPALEAAIEAQTNVVKWARAIDCVLDAALRDGNDPNQIAEALRIGQRTLCQEARKKVSE